MKKLLIYTFILIPVWCFGQVDKTKFEEIFEEETTDSKYSKRENHSGAYHYVPPQVVPAWFINPPVSNGNEVYAIGISNPGMDTTAALEQALLRAEIIANVFRKSTTQLLCDFFTNEMQRSNSIVFEHFARVTAKLPRQKGNYQVVDSYRNRFDETLVLIKYEPPKKVKASQLQTIRLELYRNEIDSKTYGVYESIYELLVQPESVEADAMEFYQLTELGKRSDVVSGGTKKENQVPIYSLKYSGLPMADSASNCFLSHGLWKDYYKSILLQILERAREKPENISFLSENYNSENNQNLTRGISVNKMRFVLTGVQAEQNQLKVKLQEVPLE